jgi:hypothetical protein
VRAKQVLANSIEGAKLGRNVMFAARACCTIRFSGEILSAKAEGC